MKDACLSCALPICDDKDARCAFVQIVDSLLSAFGAIKGEK